MAKPQASVWGFLAIRSAFSRAQPFRAAPHLVKRRWKGDSTCVLRSCSAARVETSGQCLTRWPTKRQPALPVMNRLVQRDLTTSFLWSLTSIKVNLKSTRSRKSSRATDPRAKDSMNDQESIGESEEHLMTRLFQEQWSREDLPACGEGLVLLRQFAKANPSAYQLAKLRNFVNVPTLLLVHVPLWWVFVQHRNTCEKCNEA